LISELSILDCFQHLVDKKTDKLLVVGSGDDAAVIKAQDKDLVHSVDISKINTHFPKDSSPEDIAYRSIAVALSDLAAMGAYPSFISIGLTSNSSDLDWYKKFTSGVEKILNEYEIQLVGGDVTNGEVSVCVNVFGYAYEKNILRSTAEIGDLIFITGPLGEGRQELSDWNKKEKSEYVKKFFKPVIQFKKSKYISKYASSCIDISDGLIKDLGSICKKSGVGAEIIFEKVPITNDINDLSYGDDYKLCYTCSPKNIDNKFIIQDHLIGKITSKKEIILIKENLVFDFKKNGWDSFA
jgi:thiamine-monophosphate kinase